MSREDSMSGIPRGLYAYVNVGVERPDARIRRSYERAVGKVRGKPGRPGWDRETFHAHYRAAVAAAGPDPTSRAIAAVFRLRNGEISAADDPTAYVRRLVRNYGRPEG